MSGQVTVTPGSGVAATRDPTGGTATGELTQALDADPVAGELTTTTDPDVTAEPTELGDVHADTTEYGWTALRIISYLRDDFP